MDRDTAIKLIDDHKNGLMDPVGMLNWTWLRVIIAQITSDEWEQYLEKALEHLAK